MGKKIKKAIPILLAGGMLVSSASVFVNTASASEIGTAEKETVTTSITSNSYFNDILDRDELYKLGITDSEIDNLINTPATGITLKNGVAYDANGKVLIVKERGKLSWAVKAIRAIWDKIPTNVKAAIGGVAGFEKLLGYIDHFTGSVEDAVYNGLLYIGCSPSVAWWAMKIITALAF